MRSGKVLEGLGADPDDLGQAGLVPPPDLAIEGVKLGIGRDDPNRRSKQENSLTTNSWVLGAKTSVPGSGRPSSVEIRIRISGMIRPKIVSHLSSINRAASSHARMCASKVTSGQGWWL